MKDFYICTNLQSHTSILCQSNKHFIYGQTDTNKIYELGIKVPDIAGVRIPSPITIQVPTRTRIRSAFFRNAYLSNHRLVLAAKDCSWKVERLYVVSSSSVRCWFGIVLTLACRQSNEYRANVPPVPWRG